MNKEMHREALRLTLVTLGIGCLVAGVLHLTKTQTSHAKQQVGHATIERPIGTETITVKGTFTPLLKLNGIVEMRCEQLHSLRNARITLVHTVDTNGTEATDYRPGEKTKELCRNLYDEALRQERREYHQ